MVTNKVPRGIRNNNPLNIKKGSKWLGLSETQTDPVFCQFQTMQFGVRAAFYLLRKYISGYFGLTQKFNTIELIIRRWAPETENNVQAYINAVCKTSGIPRNQKLAFGQKKLLVAIVDGMIRVECGQPIDVKIIESAYDML